MLHDIQEKFFNSLLTEDKPDILSEISTDGDFLAEQRFQIYQNNVKLILTDLLKKIYPVTVELVGEDFFNYTAFSYIKEIPPKSGDMTFYGDKFPEFLKTFTPIAELPYISYVADLEWAWYLSSMAGKKTALTPDRLVNVTEKDIPKLKFNFQPHVIFINAPYAIDKIWQAISTNKTEQLSDIKLEQETYLMIYRLNDDEVTFISMDKATYEFMSCLANEEDFATSVEKALLMNQKFTPEQHLSYLLSNQILASYE